MAIRTPIVWHIFCTYGGGGYVREIRTMWRIGALTGKPCTFLVHTGWGWSERFQNGMMGQSMQKLKTEPLVDGWL